MMLMLLCTKAVVDAQKRTSNERDDGGEQAVIDDSGTVHMILTQNRHNESERYSTVLYLFKFWIPSIDPL